MKTFENKIATHSAKRIIPLQIAVTRREQEVLEKMSEGLTVKEIARALFVSDSTIVSHKKNLLQKFMAKNAVELAVKAFRLQLIN